MNRKLDGWMAHHASIYKQYYKRANSSKHKLLLYTLALVLAWALLFLTTVFASYNASNTYSTDSNAFITTQLLSSDAQLPVTLPGPHAIIVKLPLAFIQGHLPYHYMSYTMVNIGLVVVAMLAWAILLIKLFGRKYEIPILILLSSLILTSVIFSLSLGYLAIRNIEYPLALWFVMIVGAVLKSHRFSRKQLAIGAVGSVLFCVNLAGDSIFNYATLLPLLLVIGWYWAQSRQFTLNMVKAVGLIAGVVIGAGLLKFILSVTGLINFNYAFWGPSTIIPTSSLAPSLSIALKQLMDLQGGNIFGQIINYHNLSVVINFGLLIASVFALVLILVQANRRYRKGLGLAGNNFVFVTMAVTYFVVFFIYVLSGYVITTLPDGRIISVENTRYISLMPLISSIGIIWLLKTYYSRYKALTFTFCVVLLLGTVTSYSSINMTYKSGKQLELAPSRASIDQINDILKTNDIHEVLADYWYGPVLRFWSNNSINLAQQSGCSLPLTATAEKEGTFTQRKGIKSAVIIDRGGLNYAYWACTNDQVAQIYGAPDKKLEVPGVTSTPVEIWIYDGE